MNGKTVRSRVIVIETKTNPGSGVVCSAVVCCCVFSEYFVFTYKMCWYKHWSVTYNEYRHSIPFNITIYILHLAFGKASYAAMQINKEKEDCIKSE